MATFPPTHLGYEPRTHMPLIADNDCQADKLLNVTIPFLEWAAAGCLVQSLAQNSPPGSPTGGNAWIIGASPTGIWKNFTQGTLALWSEGLNEWIFSPLRAGFIFRFGTTSYVWTGTLMKALEVS
jgi:Protein of unknown function (DUF2793).